MCREIADQDAWRTQSFGFPRQSGGGFPPSLFGFVHSLVFTVINAMLRCINSPSTLPPASYDKREIGVRADQLKNTPADSGVINRRIRRWLVQPLAVSQFDHYYILRNMCMTAYVLHLLMLGWAPTTTCITAPVMMRH